MVKNDKIDDFNSEFYLENLESKASFKNRKSNRDYYLSWSNEKDIRSGFHSKDFLERISLLLKEKNTKSILDIGTGNGIFCKWIRDNTKIKKIYGLDWVISKETCPLTQRNSGTTNDKIILYEGINWIESPSYSIPLLNKSVDVITSFDCLEHHFYDDLDLTFNEFSRVSNKMWIFSIAYHQSSMMHPIVENKNWWIDKIKPYVKSIEIIDDFYYICIL